MTETAPPLKTRRVWATGHSDTVSRSILRIRTSVGISQTLLAYKAGISRSALNAIESGQNRDLRVATLVRIAYALDVTPDALLGH